MKNKHKKLRKLLAAIKKKEGELDGMGEDRSSSFSSGSPLLDGGESKSEKEDVAASGSGKVKGPGVPQTEGKAVAKAPPSPPNPMHTHPPPPLFQ